MIQKHWKSIIIPFFVLTFLLVGTPNQLVSANVNGSVADFYNNINENGEEDQHGEQGEELPPEAETEGNQDINDNIGINAGDIVKTIFSLLFVVALLYGILKWVQKRGAQVPSSKVIKNLGGAPVGQNRSVQIIKVGNSILVVGVGEDVQLLKEINDVQEIETITKQLEEKQEVIKPKDFISKIGGMMGKGSYIQSDSSSFKDQLMEQLEKTVSKRKDILKDELKKGNNLNE